MRRLFALCACVFALLPLGAPAHADHHNGVEVAYEPVLVPLDAGFVVVVVCNASAVTTVQTDVPLATVVHCSVNGRSASRGMPGREAYVTVDDTIVGPYTVCISGEAAFVDPVTHGISVVSKPETCTTEPI